MIDIRDQCLASHIPFFFKRQIEATDRQIDHLVYELYGLTEGEIGVVESLSH